LLSFLGKLLAMVSNCIMIEAVIYGPMDMAKILALLKAPPEIIFKKPNSELPPLPKSANAVALSPGTGICVPKRNINSIKIVIKIFLRKSGIFHAFLMDATMLFPITTPPLPFLLQLQFFLEPTL